ncbi:MAG: transketolase, partial [Gammaproteobacteria bacterium]
EPLGKEEVALTRVALDWPHEPFEIPADVRAAWDARARGAQHEADWQARFDAYRARHPQEAAEFERRMRGDLPATFDDALDAALAEALGKAEGLATRKASQNALNHFGPALPELVGGSADLTGSNLTDFDGSGALRAGRSFDAGRHVNFGVREFGMSAVLNGMALHGGVIPYGGTFLTFSDYARNALRMAALMKTRAVFVFTHDSIGLGEDGPTHQPIEHLQSLRAMPGLEVYRPADAVETAECWALALSSDKPSVLALTRQNLRPIRTDA